MSAEDAALVVALEAYCHEQLKITEEQRLTEKMTLGGELPPDVQAWMGQRYPGLTFLKGHYPKLSTQVWFDAAPMECQVMIERFWGPHAAVPWIFTLKQDKRQRWKVVAREMGPVA